MDTELYFVIFKKNQIDKVGFEEPQFINFFPIDFGIYTVYQFLIYFLQDSLFFIGNASKYNTISIILSNC